MTWQPMETAPKDGSRVLLFSPTESDYVRVGWWSAIYKEWMSHQSCTLFTHATHWMPLPAPPQETSPDETERPLVHGPAYRRLPARQPRALDVTAGNIRSVAGHVPHVTPYAVWLARVEAARSVTLLRQRTVHV